MFEKIYQKILGNQFLKILALVLTIIAGLGYLIEKIYMISTYYYVIAIFVIIIIVLIVRRYFPSPPLPIPQREIYVERPPIEADCYNAILKPGALIRLEAPKKMGKTQLMNKILHHAKEKNYQTLVLDMNLIELTEVFSRQFCNRVGQKLSLPNKLDSYWDDNSSDNFNMTTYFEDYLLTQIEGDIVLALDNLDSIFESPAIAKDFCLLLRHWNQTAEMGDDLFKKLHLIVVYSTTIDTNSCPFANVGITVKPNQFNSKPVREPVQQYQLV